MPTQFDFKISTAEGVAFHGNVESVVLRCEDGLIAILPGHLSLFSTIAFTKLVIRSGKETTEFMVRHGLLSVDQLTNSAKVMAFECVKASEFREETLLEYHKMLLEELKNDELGATQVMFLQGELDSLENIVRVRNVDN